MWSLVGAILSFVSLCCSITFFAFGLRYSAIAGVISVFLDGAAGYYQHTKNIMRKYEDSLVKERSRIDRLLHDSEKKIAEEKDKSHKAMLNLNAANNSLSKLTKLKTVKAKP